MTLSLVLNAGGQSRRMGRDKALLAVPTSGQPLLRHIVQRLQLLPFRQVIVVANNPQLAQQIQFDLPTRHLPDQYPGVGPLGGIATGISACPDWGIFVACDMPLVNPCIFQFLSKLAAEQTDDGQPRWDAVVPLVAGYEQPLHALYHRSIAPAITQCLAAGERRANSFLKHGRVRWVREDELRPLDPHLYSFFNANTPEEWAEAVRLLERGV
ncbi:MAG: molybdenum cofactor guanylyltransferase [Caldilineaceae bacterium]